MPCQPLPIGSGAALTATLSSLDCQVNGAVAAGYGHIFGAGGGLGAALTTGLGVYVAVIALGLLTGHTRLTVMSLGPKVLGLSFVLAFATGWPAYQAVVYGLLTGGPDQVASAFLGAQSGATQAFAGRLDQLFGAVLEIGQALAAAPPKAPNLGLTTNLVWLSALILLIATLGILVIAKLVLAVLLALGPIFIVFGLFGGTRGLFEGWLRASVGFALAPLLLVLGGSGLLTVLGPVIGVVAEDPLAAAAEVRPVLTLFLAVVIYAGLLLTLMGVALTLTRGWRLPFGGVREAASALGGAPSAASSREEGTNQDAVLAPGLAEVRPANDDRVSGIAAALLREETRSPDHRSIPPSDISALSASAQVPGARRVEGLGQTFRTAPAAQALSGKIGS